MTKKERREEKKLEQLKKMEESKNSGNMKWIVIGLAVVLFFGFFIFAVISSKQKPIKPVTLSNSGWVRGNLNSNVTLIEYGDFQCPACRAFEPIMLQARVDYDKKIKIVFKHFPLKNAHPNAMAAAISAEAAGAQGKFWEYHDLLYDKQSEWAPQADPTENFISYAGLIKLDLDKFKNDLKNKDFEKKINDQEDEGINVGVNATPTVYVNGKYLGVPGSYDALKKEIETSLGSSK